MSRLFPLPTAVERDPEVQKWLDSRPGELGQIARHWFGVMRGCGSDFRELLHDGHPTACVGDLAFGYVNVFTSHVNIGFYLGAYIDDPSAILTGTGKFMRHVKIIPNEPLNEAALTDLIEASYHDMRSRSLA